MSVFVSPYGIIRLLLQAISLAAEKRKGNREKRKKKERSKVTFTLEQATKARRGSRSIAVLFL
jgi:hypothetical protein